MTSQSNVYASSSSGSLATATSQRNVAPASDLPPLRLSSELGRLGKHADGVATAQKLASLDADREHQLLSQSHLVQAEHASLLDAHHDQRAIWESSLAGNVVARPQQPQATGTIVAVRVDGSRPPLPGLAEAVGTVVHDGSQHTVLESALPDTSAVHAPDAASAGPARGIRLIVTLLALSVAFVIVHVAHGPAGASLRLAAPARGTDLKAGDFIASVNGVRRFSSARHAARVISNFRTLRRPIRLVCLRSATAAPVVDTSDQVAVPSFSEASPYAQSDASPDGPSQSSWTPTTDIMPRANQHEPRSTAQQSSSTSTSGFVPRAAQESRPTAPSEPAPQAPPCSLPLRVGMRQPPSFSARLLADVSSSCALAGALSLKGVFEICAGRGTLSRAYANHGFSPMLFSETDTFDQRYLAAQFRHSTVTGDFFSREWHVPRSILVVTGGISCSFVSPAGQQLGSRDVRSPITTHALASAAAYFGAPFANFENVPAIATADDGSVLRALDSNFSAAGYERVPRCPECPSQLEVVRPNLSGAPGVRDRAVGHYEWLGLAGLIGPCPRLSLKRTSPISIADILDTAPRDPTLIVHGRFSSVVPDVTNPRFPITAGFITTGGGNCANRPRLSGDSQRPQWRSLGCLVIPRRNPTASLLRLSC